MDELLRRAAGHREAGQLREAVALFRQVLERDPGERRARISLALLAQDHGFRDQAEQFLRGGLILEPAAADLLFLLGRTRIERARSQGIALLQRAARLQAGARGQQLALARTLAGAGALAESIPLYRAAAADSALRPAALTELGKAAWRTGGIDLARSALRLAAVAAPERPEPYAELALLASYAGDHAVALRLAERAVGLAPQRSDLLDLAASVNGGCGRIERALALSARSLAAAPGSLDAHLVEAYLLDLDPAADTARQQSARRRLAATLASVPRCAAHANPPDPERRLRVGYVSADFRQHAVTAAVTPVLLGHDRTQVEVILYSAGASADAVTARLRTGTDGWRPIAGLPDAAVAEQVRADGIDILVDLAMYTAGQRLALFQRRPAPVQVTAWGHLGGTGLDAFDALLTDPVVVPPDEAALFAERPVYLPCWIPYAPPPEAPPPAPRPPGRPITFGSFNRVAKMLPAALPVWCRLLDRLPSSRLVLKAAGFELPATRDLIAGELIRRGIAADRFDLLPFTAMPGHLADYGQVDIALDSFPYGGGVTTLEALWMGVPVLCLTGRAPAGRGSAAILRALGVTELIAADPADYVERGLRLAGDAAALAGYRASLRDRVASSVLCDTAYVRAVEAVYRDLWRGWCATRSPTG